MNNRKINTRHLLLTLLYRILYIVKPCYICMAVNYNIRVKADRRKIYRFCNWPFAQSSRVALPETMYTWDMHTEWEVTWYHVKSFATCLSPVEWLPRRGRLFRVVPDFNVISAECRRPQQLHVLFRAAVRDTWRATNSRRCHRPYLYQKSRRRGQPREA